ncbi:MAG: SDR family NAD(P)-dependent oxidoreductase [Stenotrophobium sp.]
MSKPTVVVIGVGAEVGVGGAVCLRFASEGYHVIAAGHTASKIEQVAKAVIDAGGTAQAVVTDTTSESDVLKLFDLAMNPSEGFAPAEVVIFNAGNNQQIDFRATTAEQFEHFWKVGCFGGFLVGREAARRLAPLGRGTILFTGASGSLRGKPGFAHFAAAKAGLRMLTQSMAREFGPLGLHVAHVVIDGGINGTRLKALMPKMVEQRGDDGLLGVEGIAEAYWFLHKQPRNAWTQELDLRPHKESF